MNKWSLVASIGHGKGIHVSMGICMRTSLECSIPFLNVSCSWCASNSSGSWAHVVN